MKASNVVAPAKATKEAPDLEEAMEEEDDEEDDESEEDVKPKKAAKSKGRPAGAKGKGKK